MFSMSSKTPSEGYLIGAKSDLNPATEQATVAMECCDLGTTLRWLWPSIIMHIQEFSTIFSSKGKDNRLKNVYFIMISCHLSSK
jgi:hypothetical protein